MKQKIILFFLLVSTLFFAQKITYSEQHLRGANTIYRNFWDVKHYDIEISTQFESKKIAGTVVTELVLISEGEFLQFDLQQPMQLLKITQLTENTPKERELSIDMNKVLHRGNHYFIPTQRLKRDKTIFLKFYFEGNPTEAKQAPWEGGWIFTKDEKGRPWLSVAVQHLGASAWFPCKDYQGDEPEKGCVLRITTPNNQTGIGNGKLIHKEIKNNKNIFTWKVLNPINTYNISPSIGNYVHFSSRYQGIHGPLPLDYWVMDYNITKAKKQFEQVPKMLKAFEHWFGPYPFYEDGYKIVETPFLGMEHQSNIAYGNKYKNGYLGKDNTSSGYGDLFDFIIIHESGHEWFGNNISAEQIAYMWIHEAFTTYSENLFVEYYYGKEAGNAYVQSYILKILNDKPLEGIRNIHQEGSATDMYYKGANIIHTLRQWMNDDKAFLNLTRGLNKEFWHTTVTAKQIEDYIAQSSHLDLKEFWEQYVRTIKIPTLVFKKISNRYYYRWENIVNNFKMPIKLSNGVWLSPNHQWKKLPLGCENAKPDANWLIKFKLEN